METMGRAIDGSSIRGCLVTCALFASTSCTFVTVEGSATPLTAEKLPLRKVLICSQSKDVTTREVIEEAFAAQLKAHGVWGIPCHRLQPAGPPDNRDIQELLTGTGADGLVLTSPTRLVVISNDPDNPSAEPNEFNSEVNIRAAVYTVQAISKAGWALLNPPWTATGHASAPFSVQDLASMVPRFVESMVQAGVIQAKEPVPSSTE